MRLVFVILFMAAIWVSGWIVGSLSPAPQFLLSPVQDWLGDGDVPDDAEVENDAAEEAGSAPAEADDASVPDIEPMVPVELGGEAALSQYRAWISEARASHPYPDSETHMFDVMMCESGGDASIVNPAGPYTGLFQYATGTWNGEWNTYRGDGITNARAQIFATALAWNLGMQNQWGCYSRAH
ncbi:MAG: hypothetical protein HRT82_09740 [Henriciella sp.]|nr:hypothetical protein [Henriciella sp.]